MVDVDLTRFRRRARIGSKGEIKIAGDGVLERHAEVVAGPKGSEWISSAGGEVWIERGGLRELVTRPRRLFDGDVIVIATWRLQYKNLHARREQLNERRASWTR